MTMNTAVTRRISTRNVLLLAALLLAGASSGLLAIGSAFVADDLTLVRAGQHMLEEDPLRPFYSPWIWEEIAQGWPPTTFFYYRPLVIATFAWDYLLWGFNPLGYHLTNVALHIAATVLVLLLAQGLFQRFTGSAAFWPPYIAALLFTLHPGHKYAVLWIAARSDLLCAVFYIGAVLMFLRWLQSPARWHAPAMFLLAVLAMGAKEMAYTLPITCAMLFAFTKGLNIRQPRWWLTCAAYTAPAAAALSLFLIIRVTLIARDSALLDFMNSPMQKAYTVYLSMRHLVLPYAVEMRAWVFEHPYITLTIAAIAAWFVFHGLRYLRQPLPWLAAAWLAVTMIPVVNIYKPWYLYIPSIGFCVLLAWLLTRPQAYRVAGAAAVALLLFSYTYQSADHGLQWREAGVIADNVALDYARLAEAAAEEPLFLCVPGEVGGVPLYMHNLAARLQIEAGDAEIAPHVAAYLSLPGGVENHRVRIEPLGENRWEVRPESEDAYFIFPEYPQEQQERAWGRYEILEWSEIGEPIALEITLKRGLAEKDDLFYYSSGLLRTLNASPAAIAETH